MFHSIMLILYAQMASLFCSIKLFFFRNFSCSIVEATHPGRQLTMPGVVKLELIEAVFSLFSNVLPGPVSCLVLLWF